MNTIYNLPSTMFTMLKPITRRVKAFWQKLLSVAIIFFAIFNPVAQATCSLHKEDCLERNDNGTDPPVKIVSSPDVAIQLDSCLGEPFESLFASGLQKSPKVVGVLPKAVDVLPSCIANTERIGIWFDQRSVDDDLAARLRGLNTVNLLQKGESFAALVSASVIERIARTVWKKAPKQLDHDGNSDINGSVHLTDSTISLIAPNQIQSSIHGYDDQPSPDVDFDLNITDTLSVSDGRVQCQTSVALKADTGTLDILTAAFLPFAFPVGLTFGIEDIIASNVDAPDTKKGSVGCQVIGFFRNSFLIPQTQLKVATTYKRVSVSSQTGISTGGQFDYELRNPLAAISGSRDFWVMPDSTTAQQFYAALTSDMRPPLTFTWTATTPENTKVADPDKDGTSIKFLLPGKHTEGDSIAREVKLQVTDADGAKAPLARAKVLIHFVDKSGKSTISCNHNPNCKM